MSLSRHVGAHGLTMPNVFNARAIGSGRARLLARSRDSGSESVPVPVGSGPVLVRLRFRRHLRNTLNWILYFSAISKHKQTTNKTSTPAPFSRSQGSGPWGAIIPPLQYSLTKCTERNILSQKQPLYFLHCGSRRLGTSPGRLFCHRSAALY